MTNTRLVTNPLPTVFADNGEGATITRSKSKNPLEEGDGPWFISLRNVYPGWEWFHGPAIYTESQATAIQGFLAGLSNQTLQAIIAEKNRNKVLFR